MDRDMNQTVCYCANVTVQDIVDAVKNGSKTFDDVSRVTLAGTGCGGCIDEVKEIIAETLAQKN